jgi:signal transduction histidine kinase
MACIVAEVQSRLAALIAEAQAEIVTPEQWPTAVGYAPWVEEIWVNYVSNAIKYGGQPPHIEVGADPQTDGAIRFWVRDNGPGLAPEQATQLFTPFTRLHQVTATGYGLGLSIVQRIAEKSGGRVGVESQPGQGSLFFFTLPCECKQGRT